MFNPTLSNQESFKPFFEPHTPTLIGKLENLNLQCHMCIWDAHYGVNASGELTKVEEHHQRINVLCWTSSALEYFRSLEYHSSVKLEDVLLFLLLLFLIFLFLIFSSLLPAPLILAASERWARRHFETPGCGLEQAEGGARVQQVDGRGTDGDEGDVDPGSNLESVHSVFGAVLHLYIESSCNGSVQVIFTKTNLTTSFYTNSIVALYYEICRSCFKSRTFYRIIIWHFTTLLQRETTELMATWAIDRPPIVNLTWA